MKKSLLLFITVFVISTMSLLAADKHRLAVLDFKAVEGVSQADAVMVTELIKTEMVNTDLFIVVERSAVDKILKEQALQETGCTETSCAVQIGRLLNANKMMLGSVSKMGSRWVITARIVDVEKGRIDFAQSRSLNSMDTADRDVARLAQGIANRISGGEVTRVVVKKTKQNKVDRPSGPLIVWSSVVSRVGPIVPGWKQIYSGKTIRGSLFIGAVLLSGGIYANSASAYSKAKADYNNPILPYIYNTQADPRMAILLNNIHFSQRAANAKSQRNRVNISTLVLGLVWGWNIIDGYFFNDAKNLSAEVRPKEKRIHFTVSLDSGPIAYHRCDNRIGMGIGVRF